MSYSITSQLIRHNLPGFTAVASQQSLEEALRRSAIPSGLEKYIDYFAILVNCTPEVVLFAVDLDEDFINVKGVAVTLMLSLQAPGHIWPRT